jgi:hypothetical protein
MLSRRPRTRSVGVRCFVLKKFMGSLLQEDGGLKGVTKEREGHKKGLRRGGKSG